MELVVHIVAGTIAGGLCGLIPTILGNRRQNSRLGHRGYVCCLVAGAFGGLLLALPTAGIFALVICHRGAAKVESAAPAAAEPTQPPMAA